MAQRILSSLPIILVFLLGCHGTKTDREATPTPVQKGGAYEIENGKVIELREQVVIRHAPPSPTYPETAKRTGVQGDVNLILFLNRKGEILRIGTRDGPKELIGSAEAFAHQIEFDVDPNLRKDLAEVRFHLLVRFNLGKLPTAQGNKG
ncbi:MAG: hypothetical protein IPL96_05245 [Holophagaceae bacterium]|nr:hypothetical protein [Holophagaceae bacterium]